MKKVMNAFIFLAIMLIIVSLIACNNSSIAPPENWHLIILGNEHSSINLKNISDEICVSVVCVLSAYEYKFVWANDTNAIIIKNEREYVFNSNEKTICAINSDINLLFGGEGGGDRYRCDSANKDMFVDIVTMSVLLQALGEERHNTNCDYNQGIICFGCDSKRICHHIRTS